MFEDYLKAKKVNKLLHLHLYILNTYLGPAQICNLSQIIHTITNLSKLFQVAEIHPHMNIKPKT